MRRPLLLLLLSACGSATGPLTVTAPLPVELDAEGVRAGALSLRTTAVGRDTLVPLDAVAPDAEACAGPACLPGAIYAHDEVVEWWAPHPRGVEQGWNLSAPPAGDGPIRVALQVDGAVHLDGDAVVFHAQGQRWRYDALSAWDADARPLPASFRVRQSRLEIVVDDTGARYPIVIDPVLSTTTVLPWSGSSGLAFGADVLADLDVNDDGFTDVLAGAPEPYTDTGAPVPGEVAYFEGSVFGIYNTPTTALSAGGSGDRFGAAMAAGDFDGDGDQDVAVGAPGASFGLGVVYLFDASPSGLSATPSSVLTGALGGFGTAVVSPGDVNADGYDDLVIYGDAVNAVYLGSASGLSSSASQTLPYYLPRRAGDWNSDGYDDVLIGLGVYLGGPSGVATTAFTTAGASADAAVMGNVNADTYGDLAVGTSAGRGSVAVLRGSASGLGSLTTISGTTSGEAFGGALGWSDVNGDGYDDLLIGSRNADDAGADAGLVEVFLGSASGITTTVYQTVLPTQLGACEGFGAALVGAGDTNNDGYEDFVVGTGISNPTAACATSETTGWLYVVYGDQDDDLDTVPATLDCDDLDAGVGEAQTWYEDLDGDGHGSTVAVSGCSQPAQTATSADDCDDTSAAVYPGTSESCNFIDDNCDGQVDEGTPPFTVYLDADGDSQGNPFSTLTVCETTAGYVSVGIDCNDANANVYTGAPEIAGNGIDEDCNTADDCYYDYDYDGYGAGTQFSSLDLDCGDPGEAAVGTDCDDANYGRNPGRAEVCDNVDNNCDGAIDEEGATGELTWFIDADGDGYGTTNNTTISCQAPSGYALSSTDCDDSNPTVSPGAGEIAADGVDNNCDGYETCYQDFDRDTFGSTLTISSSDSDCADYPETLSPGDCNDALATAYPGAVETCNGVDDDCDTQADESGATGESVFYADLDDDGYGDEGATLSACDVPRGYVESAGDCDDSDEAFNPGASESDCTDPNDYNCDGSVGYQDNDDDGFAACADCDDTVAAVNPDATEMCDGIDNNCDRATDDFTSVDASSYYLDADADGFGNAGRSIIACDQPSGYATDADDCDDTNPQANPASTVEECSTPGDLNCDGVAQYADADGDGFAACEECNDDVAYANPDAPEICDGIDDNCDGAVDELDADGDGVSDCEADLDDTGKTPGNNNTDKETPEDPACGCDAGGASGSLVMLIGAAAVLRRRRR